MPPQRPNLILPAHIPHIKLNILIRDRLNIEPHGRNGCHVLIELQFVEDRGFPSGVEPEHQKAHFFRSEDLAHHFGDLSSHCGSGGGGLWLAGGIGMRFSSFVSWISEAKKVEGVEEL
jgi:hypothetical protein